MDSIYLIEDIVYTTHEHYEIHITFILRRSDCQLPFKGEWALLGPGMGGAAHCHLKGGVPIAICKIWVPIATEGEGVPTAI